MLLRAELFVHTACARHMLGGPFSSGRTCVALAVPDSLRRERVGSAATLDMSLRKKGKIIDQDSPIIPNPERSEVRALVTEAA